MNRPHRIGAVLHAASNAASNAGFNKQPPEPPVWKLWLLRWLGLYPTLMLLYLALGPFISHWPIPVRVFLMSGLGTWSLSFLVMPRLTRWCAGWLRR
ncbi:MAG: hypothetical protein NTY70_07895 [Burkholderiales bacterium]|nr:hypothetical protein [Burkholderiales bacterium]